LNLSACHGVSDRGIVTISLLCPYLQSLNLANCHTITDSAIGPLISGCPLLHSINFSQCWDLTDEVLLYLLGAKDRLQVLNIPGCHITNTGIIELFSSPITTFPLLHTFSLANCMKVTDDSVIAIANSCPSLTSLNLCSLKTITDDSIEELALKCTNIQALYLSWCRVTDYGLGMLCERCGNLTDINLSGCFNITDVFCSALGTCCPSMKTLNLSSTHVTFDGVVYIMEHCKNLTLVDIRRCRRIQKDQREALSVYGVRSLLCE